MCGVYYSYSSEAARSTTVAIDVVYGTSYCTVSTSYYCITTVPPTSYCTTYHKKQLPTRP